MEHMGLKNMSSSVGVIIPYGKIKFMFQTNPIKFSPVKMVVSSSSSIELTGHPSKAFCAVQNWMFCDLHFCKLNWLESCAISLFRAFEHYKMIQNVR
jgi:hypothetical protein